MADDDPVAQMTWLRSPDGQAAIAAAQSAWDLCDGDALRAGSRLRSVMALSSERAAAALEQVSLRDTARTRYGITDPRLLLTRDGLEAATRPVVAAQRAEVLRANGATTVLDLTAGLGFDTRALLAAGLEVFAIERDPVIAGFLQFNCPRATVIRQDVVSDGLDELLSRLGPLDVVFADPARRDPAAARDAATARARPERDPERWSPPWSWIGSIPHPRVAAKVSPAMAVPAGWQAQWVSVDRTVVECALYSWPALASEHEAVLVKGTSVVGRVSGRPSPAPQATSLGPWLIEVDPAILRAGLLGRIAADMDAAALGPHTSWLTSEIPSEQPGLRSHRVITVLPRQDRMARRDLAGRGITRATAKCRDVAASPGSILRALGLSEGPGAVVVATTLAGQPLRVLVETAHPAS